MLCQLCLRDLHSYLRSRSLLLSGIMLCQLCLPCLRYIYSMFEPMTLLESLTAKPRGCQL